MPTKKIDQHREYSSRLLASRLEIVRALHDDELFHETKLGKALVDLKNFHHDIKSDDTTYYLKKAAKHKLVKEDFEEHIVPLVKEIDYINRVAASIRNEDHKCKHFNHFIENLESFKQYLGTDSRISLKLKEHESLLKTIHHKEEIAHLHKNAHKEDFVETLIEEFGHDKAGSAIHHYLEDLIKDSGLISDIKSFIIRPKSREEKLEHVSKLLEKRASRLNTIARWKAHFILRSKVKEIEKKRNYWKNKTAKLLDKSLEHHDILDKAYDEFKDEAEEEDEE